VRSVLRIAGREDYILAAFAFVHTRRPDILERVLPSIVDAARDRSVVSRWNLQHDGTVRRVVERHEIDRVRIRRERLILPAHRP